MNWEVVGPQIVTVAVVIVGYFVTFLVHRQNFASHKRAVEQRFQNEERNRRWAIGEALLQRSVTAAQEAYAKVMKMNEVLSKIQLIAGSGEDSQVDKLAGVDKEKLLEIIETSSRQ